MSVKPDTRGGSTLDPTTSHLTYVHTMWIHTSFEAIPTLREVRHLEKIYYFDRPVYPFDYAVYPFDFTGTAEPRWTNSFI